MEGPPPRAKARAGIESNRRAVAVAYLAPGGLPRPSRSCVSRDWRINHPPFETPGKGGFRADVPMIPSKRQSRAVLQNNLKPSTAPRHHTPTALFGIVTFRFFTCQPRRTSVGPREQNQ
jgi:hypothetical protein